MIKIVNFMSGMFYHNRKKKGMDGHTGEWIGGSVGGWVGRWMMDGWVSRS